MEREEDNQHDQHAVAVVIRMAISLVTCRVLSRVSFFFLERGGDITCRITGRRKFGNGLEVPCVYLYAGSVRMTRKLGRLLAEETHSSCPY